MALVISLLPFTIFAVLGYVVLYCAIRSESGVQAFGKILSAWLFILALLFPLSGAYLSITGFSPFEEHFQQMHGQGNERNDPMSDL